MGHETRVSRSRPVNTPSYNSLLLRLRLLQESPLQPTPRLPTRESKLGVIHYLNQIQSSGGGSDAPHGSGLDVSGLDTKLGS
ncbi:uncharacterized protein LOC129302537 [Prosopis cineraria]|uniref:uncharacterized protein LOC129302537 n=1 Tax=Prosopis cineraria TaxID=364024 RepID=UPI0024102E3F|nr:uncharacterized protein LOC129302537 [Prosopis cineraria]